MRGVQSLITEETNTHNEEECLRSEYGLRRSSYFFLSLPKSRFCRFEAARA